MLVRRLLIICLALAGSPKQAHADTVDRVYSEMKDLLEDVIRSRVVNSISGAISREHPALCFYFRGAIGRMQQSYWGGVPAQLKEGLGLMAGDFTLWQLQGKPPTTACPSGGDSAYQRFKQFVCERDRELSDKIRPCTTAAWSDVPTKIEHDCLRETGGRDTAGMPCAVAQAGMALLRGQNDEAEDIITDYAIAEIGGENARLFRLIVNGTRDTSVLARGVGDLTQLAQNLVHDCSKVDLEVPASSACWALDLKEQTSSNELTLVLYRGAKDPKDPRLGQLRALLSTNPNDAERAAAQQQLDSIAIVKPISLLPQLSSFLANPKTWLEGQSWTPEGGSPTNLWAAMAKPRCAPVEIEVWSVKATIGVSETGFCDAGTATAKGNELLRNILQIARAHDSSVYDEVADLIRNFGVEVGAANAKLTVKALRDATSKLQRLTTSAELMRGILGTREARKRSLDNLLRRASVLLRDPAIVLGSLGAKLEALRRDPAFSLMVKFIDTRDFRELAVAGLTSILESSRGIGSAERAFVAEFVAYVLDTGSDTNEQHALAKQALRTAIQQLLNAQAASGVPLREGKEGVRFAWWPSVGVRYEFGGTWYDRSTDGYRRTVSVDALSAAIPITNHFGLKLSLLDLAAPFTEYALRDNTRPHLDSWKIIADFIRPRLDLWCAVPEVTRQVALFAGIGTSALRRTSTDMGVRYEVGRDDLTVSIGVALVLWEAPKKKKR